MMPEGAPRIFRNVMREPNLSDKVADELTEAIMTRELLPGRRLPSERELGDQFGVSRTVIREAVRSLTARGLVRVTAGRGVEVVQMNSAHVTASMRLFVRGHGELDYGKIHEVRIALEVQTAGLAAERSGDADIANLRRLCDDYEQSLESGDRDMAAKLDLQFHRDLARASGNDLLLAMLDSISDILKEVRHQAMAQASVGESGLKAHRWILECVAAGDPHAARGAMEKHLAEAEHFWRTGKISAKKVKSRKRKPTA